ncbi:MAG: DUF937 domain-containing protein [Erysipelothrix sp.]|nr:DUF937 domain-containing protein [Erysipelothrix sp.]
MDIKDILTQFNNQAVMDELSKSTGLKAKKLQEAVKLGVPTIMQALSNNAKNEKGALSLSKALNDHKDDKVDDVVNFLKNVDTKDGSKMLGHIFGKDQKVENNLAKQTGIETNDISALLARLAPLLMGMLGQQNSVKKAQTNDLSSILSGVLTGKATKSIMDSVTNMFDADDGSVIDDLGKLASGFLKK